MKHVSAIEIIAVTARHFGVSPRELSLAGRVLYGAAPYQSGEGWSRADEARAVALHLIRGTLGKSSWAIARILDCPNTSHFNVFIRLTLGDVRARLQTDDLLLFAVADIEAELEAIDAARAVGAPATRAIERMEARAP